MANNCYDDDGKKKLLLNQLNELNNVIIQSLLSANTMGNYSLATDKNNEVIKPGLIVISSGNKFSTLTTLPPLKSKLNEHLIS
jgi:hypothetical protein